MQMNIERRHMQYAGFGLGWCQGMQLQETLIPTGEWQPFEFEVELTLAPFCCSSTVGIPVHPDGTGLRRLRPTQTVSFGKVGVIKCERNSRRIPSVVATFSDKLVTPERRDEKHD